MQYSAPLSGRLDDSQSANAARPAARAVAAVQQEHNSSLHGLCRLDDEECNGLVSRASQDMYEKH